MAKLSNKPLTEKERAALVQKWLKTTIYTTDPFNESEENSEQIKMTVEEKMIASILHKAIKQGNANAFKIIMEMGYLPEGVSGEKEVEKLPAWLTESLDGRKS
jgi:hypothetical protein